VLGRDGEQRPGVADRRLDLQPVAHDPGVLHQADRVALTEPSHGRRVEAPEGVAIALALAEDRHPRQPRLRAVERQLLVPAAVVVDRNAPLLVVIGDHQRILAGPETALQCARHRRRAF
jgi:hypothetical protein